MAGLKGNKMRLLLLISDQGEATGAHVLKLVPDLPRGTVYPILRQLDQEGFLSSRLEKIPHERTRERRFYQLSELGRHVIAMYRHDRLVSLDIRRIYYYLHKYAVFKPKVPVCPDSSKGRIKILRNELIENIADYETSALSDLSNSEAYFVLNEYIENYLSEFHLLFPFTDSDISHEFEKNGKAILDLDFYFEILVQHRQKTGKDLDLETNYKTMEALAEPYYSRAYSKYWFWKEKNEIDVEIGFGLHLYRQKNTVPHLLSIVSDAFVDRQLRTFEWANILTEDELVALEMSLLKLSHSKELSDYISSDDLLPQYK